MNKKVIHIIAWPVVAISLWYMPQVSSFLLTSFISHDIPFVSNVLIAFMVFAMLVNPLLSILPYALIVLYQLFRKRFYKNHVLYHPFFYGFGLYIATWIIVFIAWLLGISLPSWFHGNVR